MSALTARIVDLRPDLSITLTEAGTGRPVLILHGGGGPFTVAGIADHLAATMHTITPTHPGWNGTERPDWLVGISDLAQAYLDYLGSDDLRDVLVIGSSLGGWIAATSAPIAMRSVASSISATKMVMLSGRMAALLFSGERPGSGLPDAGYRSSGPRHWSGSSPHLRRLAQRCRPRRT